MNRNWSLVFVCLLLLVCLDFVIDFGKLSLMDFVKLERFLCQVPILNLIVPMLLNSTPDFDKNNPSLGPLLGGSSNDEAKIE